MEDTLDRLRKNQEVAALIEAREDFPELDLVFDQKQASQLAHVKDKLYRPIHILIGDQEVRCVLKCIYIHPRGNKYFRMEFTRYIIGLPNRITLPIDIKWRMGGPHHQKFQNLKSKWTQREVNLISYNDVYPRMIVLDSDYQAKVPVFRLGDLQNILPAGLIIDPEYNTLNHPIVMMKEMAPDPNFDKFQFLEDPEIGHYIRRQSKLKEEAMSFEEKIKDLDELDKKNLDGDEKAYMVDNFKQKKKPRVRKNYKNYRIKDQIKNMNLQLKDEFKVIPKEEKK